MPAAPGLSPKHARHEWLPLAQDGQAHLLPKFYLNRKSLKARCEDLLGPVTERPEPLHTRDLGPLYCTLGPEDNGAARHNL